MALALGSSPRLVVCTWLDLPGGLPWWKTLMYALAQVQCTGNAASTYYRNCCVTGYARH